MKNEFANGVRFTNLLDFQEQLNQVLNQLPENLNQSVSCLPTSKLKNMLARLERLSILLRYEQANRYLEFSPDTHANHYELLESPYFDVQYELGKLTITTPILIRRTSKAESFNLKMYVADLLMRFIADHPELSMDEFHTGPLALICLRYVNDEIVSSMQGYIDNDNVESRNIVNAIMESLWLDDGVAVIRSFLVKAIPVNGAENVKTEWILMLEDELPTYLSSLKY